MLKHAAALLVALMTLGQAVLGAETDDFRKLRGFLGSWEATAIEMAGQKASSSEIWRPILKGRFIEIKYVFKDAAGNVAFRGLVILGRDPVDEKIHGWGFGSGGGLMLMELTGWEGNKSNWSTTILSTDGTTQKWETHSFELLNRRSYRWMFATEGGNRSEAVLERVRPKKDPWPEPTFDKPEGLSQQLEDIAWWTGSFTFSGTDAFTGGVNVGQTTCGWILDGKFLLYDNAAVDGDLEVSRYRAIVGIDPATGKTTGWEFDSTGTVGKYNVSSLGRDIAGKATSPDAGLLEFKGRMTKNADGLEYEATGSLPDGKKTSYQGVWKKRN
jgi:hypothetical protein